MRLWLDLAKLLIPMIIAMKFPQLAPVAGTIAAGVSEAEEIPGASGADKLAHVSNLANAAVASINGIANKPIIDPTTANTAIVSAINTAVAVTNLVHGAVADAPAVLVPPPAATQ